MLNAGSDVFKLIEYCREDRKELEDYSVPLKCSHKSNSSFRGSFQLKGEGTASRAAHDVSRRVPHKVRKYLFLMMFHKSTSMK